VGQTVAASLQAHTLFSIANDLREMQVLASIDEADVGQIREGMDANFSVDAFPGQAFGGKITQIRLNAQNTQNVVIYTTVINFSNPDEKLLPGMTANITIPVAKHENVLLVPNGALRYKPMLSDKDMQELQAKIDARRAQREAERQGQGDQAVQQAHGDAGTQTNSQPQASPSASAPQGSTGNPSGYPRRQDQGPGGQPNAGGDHRGPAGGGGSNAAGGEGASGGRRGGNAGWSNPGRRPGAGEAANPNAPGPSAGDSHSGGGSQVGAASAGAGGGQQRRQGQLIYVLGPDKKLDIRFVRVGITNGRVTEIAGRDISEGDMVVIGQNEIPGNNNRNASQNPFQPRPFGGGGGGPRGR